ncbi:hypothetical protein C3L33_16885, partial [Rhododendron williamsianum]
MRSFSNIKSSLNSYLHSAETTHHLRCLSSNGFVTFQPFCRVKVIAYCDFLRFINTMYPTIVIATITGIASVTLAFWHLLAERSEERAPSARSTVTADGTLQLLKGRMDRMDAEVQLLRRNLNALYAEQLYFEKSADEVISTYANNVLLIMLFHGLGSVFLQVNYPYTGAGVSVVMVVSFFSAFMVAYMVTLNKMERMSEFEKNLQRRQRELQKEVTYFGAKIEASCSDRELEKLAIKGALRGVLDSIGS